MGTDLRFGMYCEVESPTGGDHARIINDIVQLVEHCDALGLDTFSTVEHPFYENFSIEVNPLALFCKLAERTDNIRFRTLCHTLPLHNPMILAGEIAMADILTNGRIECGVGRGHAWLQDHANVVMHENQGRYDESLDIMVKAWTEDRFSYQGEYYTCDNVSIVPKPIQKPHPPIWAIGSSARQMPRAAANGWGIAVGGPVPTGPFLEPLRVYREGCAEAGTTPSVTWLKAIFVAEDEDTAIREARRYVPAFVKNNFSPALSLKNNTEEERKHMSDSGFPFYADPPFLPILKWSFEKLIDEGIVYVGTPDKVGQQLLELWEQVRYDELHLISHYGDMPLPTAIRNQELFAREIIPTLRRETAGARTAA